MRPCAHRFQIGTNAESEPSSRREDQRTTEVSVDEQDLRKYDEIATKTVFDFLAQAAGLSPNHISFGKRELPTDPQRKRTLPEVWRTRHWVGKHARKPRHEYERLFGHVGYTYNDAPWGDVPTYAHRNVWVFEEGTVSLVEGGEGPERDTALGSGRHRWDPEIGSMERQPSDGFEALSIPSHFIRTMCRQGLFPFITTRYQQSRSGACRKPPKRLRQRSLGLTKRCIDTLMFTKASSLKLRQQASYMANLLLPTLRHWRVSPWTPGCEPPWAQPWSLGFQMISQRCPSRSRKYPE
jgi:hypothetical protein